MVKPTSSSATGSHAEGRTGAGALLAAEPVAMLNDLDHTPDRPQELRHFRGILSFRLCS